MNAVMLDMGTIRPGNRLRRRIPACRVCARANGSSRQSCPDAAPRVWGCAPVPFQDISRLDCTRLSFHITITILVGSEETRDLYAEAEGPNVCAKTRRAKGQEPFLYRQNNPGT
jgi:hypothetical protein